MKTILVLEDEPTVMKLLRCILAGYNLIEAGSAEEALRLFIRQGRQLDLLLADLILPESSGVQVALMLRSEIPGLPVILTSGYPVSCWSERDCADVERLGSPSVVVPKPFRAPAISNAVSELIGMPHCEIAMPA